MIVLLLVGVVLSACQAAAPEETADTTPDEPTPATLSLDWVPNTNHTGFYVALDKGWYAEEGIDLDIQSPADPSAALRQVAAGNTEFGVSFQEEVTIARSSDIPIVSIGAIIQHNTAALAALADSGIRTAADFEGKTYASYGLPIERPILEGLMGCEGADADTVEFVDVGFDAFPALLSGRGPGLIFLGWDGIAPSCAASSWRPCPFTAIACPTTILRRHHRRDHAGTTARSGAPLYDRHQPGLCLGDREP